jgi:dihydrofolate synthase/folylpolyglutamate synthase
MQILGNPQDSLSFVHIAGTNGKGSTAAFLSEILVLSGYKTGLFTSPFLYEFNERMRINGENIPDEELSEIMIRVQKAAEQMEKEGEEYPTEFDMVTAMAFCYFAQEKCDIVVLEVGLGGRFDATNIINTPLVSVITSLSLDHTQYLGNTIEEIAFEKCGIIKEGGRVVCYGNQPQEALEVIEKMAKERSAGLYVCDFNRLSDCKVFPHGNEFVFYGESYSTNLLGEYQIYNAVTAISAAKELINLGYNITIDTIKEGIKNAKWSGRLEVMSATPLIIADGSHNADGMQAFVSSAKKLIGDKKAVCVVGMMKDKDVSSVLLKLSEGFKTVVFTTVNNPRAATADELFDISKDMFDEKYTCHDNGEALRNAINFAGEDGVVFAVGSLYMIDSIKKETEKILKNS